MNENNTIRLKNTMQGEVLKNTWILPPPLISLHTAAIRNMDFHSLYSAMTMYLRYYTK